MTALEANTIYTFHRLNGATTHPFAIDHSGAQYSTGSVTNGITGSATITVDTTNVNSLSYKCTSHPSMVGQLSVRTSECRIDNDYLAWNCGILEDEKLYCWGDAGSCSRDSESYSYTEVTTKYSGTCYGYASSVKVFSGSACANPVLCEHKCSNDITCDGFTGTCSDPSRAGTETDCNVCSNPFFTTETDCVLNVQHVAAGEDHTVALLNDGTLKAWGKASYGLLGYENNIRKQPHHQKR